ncbi:glycosyltransferase family 2 protein [Candidatus Saccharibacteria bacterium]|nr:glycosyltransferase family 2 protein [Candidatus Saccharibacteria bacterium]
MNNPTVSVVVPNWNGMDVIGDCLKSLQKQSYKLAQIIVVENGSIDGSIQYIEKHFPDVVLLKQPKNLGFAGGVNVGIRAATSDYVFLLNNDAECEPDCIEQLLKAAVKHQADITQAIIVTGNGKYIDSAGDTYSTWGLPYPCLRNEPVSELPTADKPILSASGGASVYKRSLFDEIGLFDEIFFAYYEDVDISLRAQLRNKKLWLASKAIVQHKMNHTADRIPGFGREMTIKNSIYMFWKDLPFPLIIKVFPRFLYANWRMTASAIVKGHPVRALLAQLVALLHTPHLLVRRIRIQHNRTISSRDFEKLLSQTNPFKAVKKLDKSTPKAINK